jgi:hypothetical protein
LPTDGVHGAKLLNDVFWQNCVVVIKELLQEVERRVSDSLLHFLLLDIGSYQFIISSDAV